MEEQLLDWLDRQMKMERQLHRSVCLRDTQIIIWRKSMSRLRTNYRMEWHVLFLILSQRWSTMEQNQVKLRSPRQMLRLEKVWKEQYLQLTCQKMMQRTVTISSLPLDRLLPMDLQFQKHLQQRHQIIMWRRSSSLMEVMFSRIRYIQLTLPVVRLQI